jgi:hypothetical protein
MAWVTLEVLAINEQDNVSSFQMDHSMGKSTEGAAR